MEFAGIPGFARLPRPALDRGTAGLKSEPPGYFLHENGMPRRTYCEVEEPPRRRAGTALPQAM
jgi:hypothetical protein